MERKIEARSPTPDELPRPLPLTLILNDVIALFTVGPPPKYVI